MVNRSKLLITVFLLMATFVATASLYSGKSQKAVETYAAPYPPAVTSITKESKILAPDGKMSLVVNEVKGESNNTWTGLVGSTQVFKESLATGDTMAVPFNVFSPDDKYIFLKIVKGGQSNYIVVTTSGKPIAKDGETVEISEAFYAKYPNYKITDVTGWAAPTLLVINTDKTGGGKGPSFWFDINSKSFTQLSTRFD